MRILKDIVVLHAHLRRAVLVPVHALLRQVVHVPRVRVLQPVDQPVDVRLVDRPVAVAELGALAELAGVAARGRRVRLGFVEGDVARGVGDALGGDAAFDDFGRADGEDGRRESEEGEGREGEESGLELHVEDLEVG